MYVIRVSKDNAEKVRKELVKLCILDKKKKILANKFIDIPITRKLNNKEKETLKKYEILEIEQENPDSKIQKKPRDEILNLIEIPKNYKKFLPKKWEKFGDILIFKLPKELNDFEREIGEAYAKILRVKTVAKETAPICGKFRIPNIKVIYGNGTETIHKENGIKFKFDAKKIMFSSGNIDERKRMAYISNKNEVIVDMFAGIGYFSIPLAYYSKPKKIYAIEINKTAYFYLCENIKLNNVSNIVSPIFGDNRKVAPKNIADRVIMGYLKNSHKFLSNAIEILNEEGIIHYHGLCPNELFPKKTQQIIKNEANKCKKNAKIINIKKIKSFAPGISHVVVDVEIY